MRPTRSGDGTFLEGAAKEAAEARCIDAGLAGIHLLWELDSGIAGEPRPLVVTGWRQERGAVTTDPAATPEKEAPPMATKAYCVKCKAKRDMNNEHKITMKNGKPATEGVCPVCGTKMFKIGG